MLSRLKKFILFFGDLIFLAISLFLMIAIRYPQASWLTNFQNHLPHFLVVFAIWLIVLYINGLYNLNLKTNSQKFFSATISTVILSGLISIIYFYLSVQSTITPRTNLFIFIAIFTLLFFIWRNLYQALVSPLIPKSNLAIIGFNK